ncbi:hypothetical protein GGE65_007676 [Skermanella aerolata]|uniref:hypothetical protein n=1 Tax=Skermanella aerolata TaxID=393310 RepID=UPI003D1C9DD9
MSIRLQGNGKGRITIGHIGDNSTFATLSIRRLGSRIELISELTAYLPSGNYLTNELARELAEGEDECVAISTDMEWAAQDELRVMDIEITKDPSGWPEALITHFDKAHRAFAYSSAITQEAALIAAE